MPKGFYIRKPKLPKVERGERIKPVNREELAWAAGFFDGEGYIGLQLSHGGNAKNVRMSVYQTSLQPIERFHKAVWGLGRLVRPRTTKSYLQRKPMYEWRSGRYEEVQAVVALLWNFLSEPKRQQARTAMLTYLERDNG